MEEEIQEQCRLLGHYSTITDIALSSKSNLIATADRDNRIRISRLQQPFVIETFCLGHTDFITSLAWICDGKFLISASNDGTLNIWNPYNGKLIDSMKVSKQNNIKDESYHVVGQIRVIGLHDDIICFTLFSSKCLYTICGLSAGKFGKISCSIKFDDVITGICINEMKNVLVSLNKNESMKCIHQFEMKYDQVDVKSVSLLKIKIEGDLGLGNDESLSTSYVDNQSEDLSFLRMEWLQKQKKKEMVMNWKGKKRQHVEI